MPVTDYPRLKGHIGALLAFYEADIWMSILLPFEGDREHDSYKIQLQTGFH
jgi:hypothetical protein